MGKRDIYTVDNFQGQPGIYTVRKFDEGSGILVETYTVSEITESAMVCTCFAGGRPTCRHRQMLRLFQAEERVGQGWMYKYDAKIWVPPQNPD